MFHLIGKIPSQFTVACSGGPDSMAAVSFFKLGRKDFKVAYFNHETHHGDEAHRFLNEYCGYHRIPMVSETIKGTKPKGASWEEYWREERYKFLHSISGPVVTCHHLSDQMENWVLSSIHGRLRMIRYQKQNAIRPFLLITKQDLIEWCQRKEVPYLVDPSNADVSFMRNRVRNLVIPEILKVNPGFEKVVRKQVQLFLHETKELA